MGITKFMQSSLVASHLLGAAALSALFFSSSGDVLSVASPEDCETEDNVWRSAAVGIISALVTSIPMIFVAASMKRYFVLRESWDEAAKRRQLRRWRRKDRSIWTLCFLYNCLCTLFIAAFLANIRPGDAQKWLDSLVGIFVEDFLLQPMVVAVIYTLITALLVSRNPGLLEEVRNDLRILDDDDTTSTATDPLPVSITPPSLLHNIQTKRSHSANGDALDAEIALGVADEACHKIREFPRSAWSLQVKGCHSVLSDAGVPDPRLNVSTTNLSSAELVSPSVDSRISEVQLDAGEASHQSSVGQLSRFNHGALDSKCSFV